MKIKKNLIDPKHKPVEVEYNLDHDTNITEYPDWYKQYLDLGEKDRKEILRIALNRVKKAKPDTYNFIKKFKCELIGITPRTEYSLVSERDGEVSVTFVHAYSMPTLMFWCPAGQFHFSINANLKYNDTVLNAVQGNKIDRKIRGLTS